MRLDQGEPGPLEIPGQGFGLAKVDLATKCYQGHFRPQIPGGQIFLER